MGDYESKDKMVSHPEHYMHGNLETIDVIEAFIEGLPAKEAFLTGQVIKYISRWGQKNGLQDLEKAQWYLQRLIDFEIKNTEKDILSLVKQSENIMSEINKTKDVDFMHGKHIPLPEEEL